jgi:hypothetical protein
VGRIKISGAAMSMTISWLQNFSFLRLAGFLHVRLLFIGIPFFQLETFNAKVKLVWIVIPFLSDW